MNMFEFGSGATPAPKVFLNTATGEVMGASGDDGHGHGGSGTHAYGTEPPAPKPGASVHCSYQGDSHRVTLSCGVGGGGKGAGAVRFRLVHRGKVLGTSRATISGGRVHTVVHSKRELGGSYKLLATVDHRGGVTALSQSVELPGSSSVQLH